MGGQASASIIEPLSRIDRVAGRGIRERDRKVRAAERSRPNRAEAEAHERLIARLTEAHQAPFKRIDWVEILADGPVAPTIARDATSAAARRKLAEYRPSLMDSMLGRERERRRELMEKVIEAAKVDAALWARAVAEADSRNRVLRLAPDVKALKAEAIVGVLKATGVVAALGDVVEAISLHDLGPERLVVRIDLLEYDSLPDTVCRTGTATAPMPEAERYELQLANACSAALRAAAEVLQVAPVETVEVVARVCPPGGLAEADMEWILYVKVPAATLAGKRKDKVEAAALVADLGPRLNWTSARGFRRIEIDDLGLSALAPARASA